jgi:hypothetical protein
LTGLDQKPRRSRCRCLVFNLVNPVNPVHFVFQASEA